MFEMYNKYYVCGSSIHYALVIITIVKRNPGHKQWHDDKDTLGPLDHVRCQISNAEIEELVNKPNPDLEYRSDSDSNSEWTDSDNRDDDTDEYLTGNGGKDDDRFDIGWASTV